MKLFISTLAGFGLLVSLSIAGCGLVGPHADCDQVAQQQRTGQSDTEIAQANGLSIDQVQGCSQSGSSGSRETANNYQDQPRLPAMAPTLPSGIFY